MPAAPSFADLVAIGEAELRTKRPELLVLDGDITEANTHSAASMADTVIRYGAQAFKNTFIDGSDGDDLTTLVDDHYNIQRQEATAAAATVLFTRTSGGVGGTILAGTTIATEFDANGETIEFTTDSNLVFASGANGPSSVAATATAAGKITNVATAAIARVIDQPAFDTFTVTNPARSAGGNDQETDTELRDHVRTHFQTLRRGTLSALEQGAREVPAVRVATASEDATGLVTLYVADSDGNSSIKMISDVETEMVDWKAAGTTLTVLGGDKSEIDMTIEITNFRTGFSVVGNASEIETIVASRIDKLKVAETLYLDSIIVAAISPYADDIYNITITAISKDGVAQSIADLAAGSNEIFRSGTITVTE